MKYQYQQIEIEKGQLRNFKAAIEIISANTTNKIGISSTEPKTNGKMLMRVAYANPVYLFELGLLFSELKAPKATKSDVANTIKEWQSDINYDLIKQDSGYNQGELNKFQMQSTQLSMALGLIENIGGNNNIA